MRVLRHHIRFLAAFAVGALLALLVPLDVADRILIGADVFFLGYLGSTLAWIGDLDGEGLRRRFADADEGGALILLVALAAVGVSLYAIVATVTAPPGRPDFALRPFLALGAVPLGWAVVHTVMAFHYARIYYGPHPGSAAQDDAPEGVTGGLDFAGNAAPGAWDFMYYSFTLGMTAQTSDTGVTTSRMRRVTLAHSVLCYFYNAVIVALAVNAGLQLGAPSG